MKAKLYILLSFFPTLLSANEMDTLAIHNMDEVVVVSTPKEHTALRQQSLSSSTFGAWQLQEKSINNIKDLTSHVPGLFIPSYGSRLTSSVYLRGVGSRIGTPAIGMYVDDIPLANMSSMDQDLSDADRIDVLRGPQGTLYGRNTIGGLIRVYTKNPMNYQGTDIMLGGATYNNYRARVTHYHRPNDKFAFSAGVSYEHLGGFFKNIALNNQRADKGDDIAARWRGIFIPSDKVRLDLSARYQWSKQGGYPYAAKEGDDAGEVAYNRASSYKRHLLTLGLNAEHDLGKVMMTSTTGFQFLKDDMFMDQDFSRLDIYTLQQKQKSKTLSEEIAVKSKDNQRWQWTSGANIQYQWLATQAPVTFYQDGLDWLSQMTNTNANRFMPTVQSGPMTMAFNFDDRLQALDGQPTATGVPFATDFSSPMLTTGLFHQSIFNDLFGANGLSLSLGLRLDYERMWLDYDASYAMQHTYQLSGHLSGPMERDIAMVPANTYDVEGRLKGKLDKDYLQLMPRFSLQYAWGETGNVYATVSRGYRSGGYNIQMFNELMQPMMRTAIMQDVANATIPVLEAQRMVPADTKAQVKDILQSMAAESDLDVDGTIRYKPETAWNYEIGSHLNLFDGKLKADLAAFWIETHDLQISQMSESGMGRVTVNAEKSRSIGMEASMQATVTDALSLNAGYGYTHATLRHSGNEEHPDDYFVPFAPQHTLTLGARYVWNTRGWLQHICLYTGGRANGRIYWTRENDLSQPFYALLDARLSVTHNDLELSLWGNNLTCTHYDAFSFVTRSQVFSQRGTPLQVGLDLRLKL
ncbi:MAG: TonB-dependent receptor [Bacteroidaceae bacterium]|nr:TonB-dependent receptor [Bacteroidaceae bacterium]